MARLNVLNIIRKFSKSLKGGRYPEQTKVLVVLGPVGFNPLGRIFSLFSTDRIKFQCEPGIWSRSDLIDAAQPCENVPRWERIIGKWFEEKKEKNRLRSSKNSQC